MIPNDIISLIARTTKRKKNIIKSLTTTSLTSSLFSYFGAPTTDVITRRQITTFSDRYNHNMYKYEKKRGYSSLCCCCDILSTKSSSPLSSFVFREKLSHHSHQSLQQQRLLQYHQHRQLLLIGRGFVHTQNDGSTNNNDDNDSVVGIVDYFKLFDLQRKFGIPLPELKKRYLMLMTEYHPDKQQQRQQKEKENNNSDDIITAEIITHAYKTLQLPHTRASHLLELLNCPLTEYDNNNNSDNDDGGDGEKEAQQQHLVGMDFLMDMMEWRERIENAVGNDDSSSSNNNSSGDNKKIQDELRTISEETQLLQTECEELLKHLFDYDNDKDIGTTLDENDVQEGRKLTAQLQYWYRLKCILKEEMDI